MSLQLDTFDKKEQLVDNYINEMKNYIKEKIYSGDKHPYLNANQLEAEQLQCRDSFESGYCYANSSVIDLMLEHGGVDKSDIDQDTFKQMQKLYLHKRYDMLDEIIHILDPKRRSYVSFSELPSSQADTVRNETITFKELYDLFLQEKGLMSPDTCKTTYRDYQSAYNDFLYVIEGAEDRDISSFSKEDFREFVNALHFHLPVNRTKMTKFRDLPYSKLKEIELTDKEKLATNTKQKKISAIKQMFDIAIDPRYQYLENNEAEVFLLKNVKGKKKQKTQRLPLSDENWDKFLDSPIYTTEKVKTLALEPHKYWIPLLARYSGMRQNEMCQLYIEDIKEHIRDDGSVIYYFDLNEDKDKHLKNANAPRKVPIHPYLIELGFLDYYNDVKNRHERLWPELRYHPTEHRYNTDYNTSFMKYFRRYVTKDESQVFHSIRHNVGDQLIKNTVKQKLPTNLVNVLMGHEPHKDMTTRGYSQGYGIEELYEGIKTIEFI